MIFCSSNSASATLIFCIFLLRGDKRFDLKKRRTRILGSLSSDSEFKQLVFTGGGSLLSSRQHGHRKWFELLMRSGARYFFLPRQPKSPLRPSCFSVFLTLKVKVQKFCNIQNWISIWDILLLSLLGKPRLQQVCFVTHFSGLMHAALRGKRFYSALNI